VNYLNEKRLYLLVGAVLLLGGSLLLWRGIAKADTGSGPFSRAPSLRQDSPNTPSDSQLVNGGFEAGWDHTPVDIYNAYGLYVYTADLGVGEIFVPDGWTAFFRHGPPVAHDDENNVGWAQPEVHVINNVPPFVDPPRVHEGQRALKLFTLYKIHDAGLYQQVNVPPGTRWRLYGWAHTWTTQADDPYQSTGDPLQAWLLVGLDPAGGKDPFAPTVVWGEPGHIYDDFAPTPPVEATAEGGTLTVFIRSWVLYPYKHNDVYWDAITLQPMPVLTAEPAGRSVYQGEAITYTVALTATPELALPFTLTLDGLPGAASRFDPPALEPGATATLVVTPSLSTPIATHVATILGSGTVAQGTVRFPITTTTQIALTVWNKVALPVVVRR
jgi:hypothetical protein